MHAFCCIKTNSFERLKEEVWLLLEKVLLYWVLFADAFPIVNL